MSKRYLWAISITAIAIAIRFLVGTGPDNSAFAILLFGMLAAAWTGGVGPCLVAQTIILLVHRQYFAEPAEQIWPPAPRAFVNISAYYGVGLTVAVLSDFVRAARSRDRKSTADARDQRERLQAMLACMADGVIATDAAGKIALMNPMAESLLETSAAESNGKSLSEIFRLCDGSSREPVPNPFQRAAHERGVVHSGAPLQLLTHGGRAIPVAFSAAPISDSLSGPAGVVIVFRDESERRSAEEALRDADRRKDEFLATLAHELRNPLAPICMGLEIMKLAATEGVSQLETHAMVERQTRHMVRLIDDLLDVSRITRGKLELRKSQINLQTAVNNVLKASRGAIAEAGHELVVDLPAQPVAIDADPDRFMQILSNLLNNAAKYTPPGGRICVDVEVRGDELQLTVADNGRGIASDRLTAIFEMFNQSNNARESGHSGLGIGLTLSKRLVEMHGGTLEAKSDGVGCGSAFVIRMPVAASQPDAPQAIDVRALQATASPCKVLLVDDNRDSLSTMSALVAASGHQVLTASDGLEAIEVAERFGPDVILMDLGMPRMNGYDAAREIRRRTWGKKVRLIAVTGWGQAADRRRTEEAGFDGHLVKPIDLAALSQALTVGRRDLPEKDGRFDLHGAPISINAADMTTDRGPDRFAEDQLDSQMVE